MEAVVANRPNETLDAWDEDQSERVLQRVLGARRASQATLAPRSPRRRWAQVAAVVALLAAAGLFAQVLLPMGTNGSPQAAQALDRLADAVPASPAIPEGSFELTVYEASGVAMSDDGPVAYSLTRSTWTAADGWAWAHQTGDDAAYYIFSPVPSGFDLSTIPAHPSTMESYLRARVTGSTSTEEALFEAVKATLTFTPTPADTRAAAIRMLAGVSGITVTEDATDPAGRTSTKVAFVDPDHRPGIENAIFLDPETTQLTAQLFMEGEQVLYSSTYTQRRIVADLPPELVEVLGSERIEKAIQ